MDESLYLISLDPKATIYKSVKESIILFLNFLNTNFVVYEPLEIFFIFLLWTQIIVGSYHGRNPFFVPSVILSPMHVIEFEFFIYLYTISFSEYLFNLL